MEFNRTIHRAALAFTLLLVSAAAQAAPVREPVVVTTLADPETDLVAVGASNEGPSVDDRIRSFSQAIIQAAAAERQAIAVRCRSIRDIPAAGSRRGVWEANCRYQRR
jgi:hypothetical protein